MRRKINKKEDEEGASKIFDGSSGEMDLQGKRNTPAFYRITLKNQVS